MSTGYLFGSTVVHVIAIWALFVFVPASRLRPSSRVIQVALVNLPSGAVVPSRGTPEAQAVPARQTPEKKKLEAPEKNAVRIPKRGEAAPRARPAPGLPGALRTETAPLGASGLSGDVAVDATNFEFTYYLIAVRNRVSQNWGAPAGIATNGNRIRATVHFRIDRFGRVSDVRLEESSGVPFFDQSAVRAVSVSNPLPPLPAGYGESSLGVHFGFEYADR